MAKITDADFELALQLEEERAGWCHTGLLMSCINSRAEFMEKSDSKKDVHFHVKSSIYLEGISMDKCFALLTVPEQRNKWDKGFFELEKLDSSDCPAGTDLIYWKVHLQSPMKDRDMVQLTAHKMMGNACVIVYKQGDDSKKPESNDYIRMRTGLSYTILRPAVDDPSSSTLLSTLGNNDYGGWIPNCIMGFLYSISITNLSKRLLKA